MKLLATLIILIPLVANGAMPYDAICRIDSQTGGGSGVLIQIRDGKGLIVTNAHVVSKSAEGQATWNKQTRIFKVIKYIPDVDLAFLVVDDPPTKAATIGMRDTHIVFSGYPHYDRGRLHYQYGNFIEEDLVVCIWFNKPVPGMSGGAVFDRKDGDLCGIIKASIPGNPHKGVGVSDISLIIYAWRMEKEEWKPDSSYLVDDEEEWNFAKPSRQWMTKIYDERAPHWEK